MAETAKPRAHWQERLFASAAEADQHDAEFWAQIPPEDRMQQVGS